jgi:type II secretory pathway predicted ATPase ExeA
LTDERGIGLLHGPESSDRLALIEQYVEALATDQAIAVVDGARLKTPQLLTEILARFGYDVELNSTAELLNMLHVFVVQQTRSYQAPVLILGNINDMYPSALCVLCKLAALTVHNQFALRIVLVGNRRFRRVLDSPSMRPIADRMIGDLELKPLTANESLGYLYARLQSHGVERPDSVFSIDVCTELHEGSGGWPVLLDDIALAILEKETLFPIRLEDVDHPAFCSEQMCGADFDAVGEDTATNDEPPMLIVTHNGDTLQEIRLTASRILIGRSSLCDLAIDDEFVSKQHAALIRVDNAVILIDLKSSNGTYVNSRRIQRRTLRDSDVVSLGEHRIKVVYPEGYAQTELVEADDADTASMRNITESQADIALTGKTSALRA